ncbi:MAG: methyl-accepting chemotaxis protein, partial [Lachnospiraceae bacterium]
MKKLTSISGKIVSLVSVSMIVVVSIVMMIIIPRAKSNISTVTENYMIDLATITGEQIENVRAEKGSNVAFNVGTLSRMVRNVAVSDISSSYTYVVSGEGTMLFHPTADKIGQPVENDAVKHLVSEIESGNIPDPSVI